MTHQEFEVQMDRMVSQYGAKTYSDERKKLIWDEMNHLPLDLFTKLISRLISENLTPPLLPKFREAAAGLRDASWQQDKQQYAQDAREFGSIQNAAGRCVSFSEYIQNAIKRNDPKEMRLILEVYGPGRVEKALFERAPTPEQAHQAPAEPPKTTYKSGRKHWAEEVYEPKDEP